MLRLIGISFRPHVPIQQLCGPSWVAISLKCRKVYLVRLGCASWHWGFFHIGLQGCGTVRDHHEEKERLFKQQTSLQDLEVAKLMWHAYAKQVRLLPHGEKLLHVLKESSLIIGRESSAFQLHSSHGPVLTGTCVMLRFETVLTFNCSCTQSGRNSKTSIVL